MNRIIVVILLVLITGCKSNPSDFGSADQKFIANYRNLTCEDLLTRLEYDKQQSNFIYNCYGFYTNRKARKEYFKKEYNVNVVPVPNGCIGKEENDCYNKALMEYLNQRKD